MTDSEITKERILVSCSASSGPALGLTQCTSCARSVSLKNTPNLHFYIRDSYIGTIGSPSGRSVSAAQKVTSAFLWPSQDHSFLLEEHHKIRTYDLWNGRRFMFSSCVVGSETGQVQHQGKQCDCVTRPALPIAGTSWASRPQDASCNGCPRYNRVQTATLQLMCHYMLLCYAESCSFTTIEESQIIDHQVA